MQIKLGLIQTSLANSTKNIHEHWLLLMDYLWKARITLLTIFPSQI